MVPDAHWAGNLLTVLHLWPSRLAIIVSPWVFGPALTSYRTYRRTSNFPTGGANCRVTVFRLSPLQWICKSGSKSWALMRRRLVLGMKSTQNRAAQHPREKGPLARGQERANLSWSHRSLLPFPGPPFLSWDLCCYISFSSVHPPPTLVSHLCQFSSARPIGDSFWCSVSCCDPHRTVQGSHPH